MPNDDPHDPDDTPDEPPVESTDRPSVDEDELVGPGRYPLRIQPAAAIQPGEQDARRLLRIWFVRKLKKELNDFDDEE